MKEREDKGMNYLGGMKDKKQKNLIRKKMKKLKNKKRKLKK